MWKKIASLATAIAVIPVLCSSHSAARPKSEPDAKAVEKAHAAIVKIGTGPAARVEVNLRDNTKLKGYVDQVAQDHFVVVDDHTGTATKIAYPQVKQVKGNNLSTGAKIALGVIAFIAFCTLFAWASSER